jgi:hypothetical protein
MKVVLVMAGLMTCFLLSTVLSSAGTDFPGTVLMVDPGAGKIGVKKEQGGTRFTFVVTDKTKFNGPGWKSLADVKKGDDVNVTYTVNGSQYVADQIAARPKKP